MESDNCNGPTSPVKYIEATDYDLQFPTWSLENLRKLALHHRLVRPQSLAWAILLNALPSPSGDLITSIKLRRNFYSDLKDKWSTDPRDVIGDDPLSQDDESVWKQHFCDNELKALILQDVVRTFPDDVYFRDKDVQDLMVRVLFLWARAHGTPGYRQGMHEVLAPLLRERSRDAALAPAPAHLSDTLRYYLDDDYLEHDSFTLFSAVMVGLERFYCTGEPAERCGRLPLSTTKHRPTEVVRYLQRVRDQQLVPREPALAAHLARCGIAMELFGIRWLRLLFGREFNRAELPALWGFVFADGPALPHLHLLVVALLLALKDPLLSLDAGGALSLLMRAPGVPAAHVTALALHLRAPATHPRPPPHLPPEPAQSPSSESAAARPEPRETWSFEQAAEEAESSGSEGLAEGGDVARSLAALALLRARLPPAAAALQAALPRPPPQALAPLQQIMQLAALLQCRNHALIDVETALEAAENTPAEGAGRRQLVPVRLPRPQAKPKPRKVKEVPLKLFHQVECDSTSDLPFLDPLRLRTE